MDIKKITGDLSVSGQILLPDISELARLGYKSLICNRPDGESADQPSFAEVAQVARQCGLEVRSLPAQTGKVTDEQGAAFGILFNELPKPVLAYCRTGVRSITMWALS
jgi:sulfide:quinone oxidoreductase